MATRKNTTYKRHGLSKDELIIRACIDYAAICSAIEAAFHTDPDPDSVRAEKYDTSLNDRRLEALELATAPAETPESIRAKAEIVWVVLRQASDIESATLSMQEMRFIKSVGLDTAAFLRRRSMEENVKTLPPDLQKAAMKAAKAA